MKRVYLRFAWKTCKWVLVFVICVFLLCVFLFARFMVATPSPSHNYLVDLNATAESIADEDRAWPLYRQALVDGFGSLPLIKNTRWKYLDLQPGGEHWETVLAHLDEYDSQLLVVREASRKPGLGFALGKRFTADERDLWPGYDDFDYSFDNHTLFDLLLPHLSDLRRLAQLLSVDARRAVMSKVGATFVEDVIAMFGIARHMRESPLLICDLVSLIVINMTFDEINKAIARHPESFSDHQLRELLHEVSSFSNADLRVQLEGERMTQYDLIQRAYTDDGNGDGRLTRNGLRLVLGSSYSRSPFDPESLYVLATAVLKQFNLASRKTVMKKTDEFFELAIADSKTPIWERESIRIDVYFDELCVGCSVNTLLNFPNADMLPAVGNAALQGERIIAALDATMTAIALEIYRRQFGNWPDSLDQLVPSILEKVPLDRFDGKHLKYVIREGKPIVYSVGMDRDDDGGHPPKPGSKDANTRASFWKPITRVKEVKVKAAASGKSLNEVDHRFYDGDWILWPPIVDPVENN